MNAKEKALLEDPNSLALLEKMQDPENGNMIEFENEDGSKT